MYDEGYCGVCFGRHLVNEGRSQELLDRLPAIAAVTHPEPARAGGIYPGEDVVDPTTATKRRRAEAYAAGDHGITKEAVYEADGGMCQLCGKWVDPDLGDKHPMMKSIDHIIPLLPPPWQRITPGTHTWGNVQLAHLGCNQKKTNHSNPLDTTK